MKKAFIILALSLMCQRVASQEFDDFFSDATLRIDYNFSGNTTEQHIAVSELKRIPRWYGKRRRLAEVPMEGNGQITVRCHKTGEVIYRNSFSTLFQEWLAYPEAATVSKAFENVFLVPMPLDTVDITVDLRDGHRNIIASLTHEVMPTDILIRHIGEKNVTPYTTILQASDSTRAIHIAYLAEGYTQEEMDVFLNDAREATEALFAHEPFKSMQERFNIIAVESPSTDSGTSEPAKGIWKDTALGSHFDTFYSDRYLTTLNINDLHDWLAGTPYEHIIVLVNTEKYGGGGILNSYNLSMTHHEKFKPVVVHEFGHSFAGLADEYAYENEAIPMYPEGIEPWEENITRQVDFGSKWADMMGADTEIGLYEGGGYSTVGIWRAYPDCRMRTNENPEFCPVCRRALQRVIDFYTADE